MTSRKKQVSALGGTVGMGGQASGERFAEITSGTSCWQQGLSGNLQRLLKRGYKPKHRRGMCLWQLLEASCHSSRRIDAQVESLWCPVLRSSGSGVKQTF